MDIIIHLWEKPKELSQVFPLMNKPSKASLRGSRNRSNSISSIAAKTSPAFRVFRLAFMAKLFALWKRKKKVFFKKKKKTAFFYIKHGVRGSPGCCVQHKNTGSLRYCSSGLFRHVDPVWKLKKTQITISTVVSSWLPFKTFSIETMINWFRT